MTVAKNGIGPAGEGGAGGVANLGGATSGTTGTMGAPGGEGVTGGVWAPQPNIRFGSYTRTTLQNTIVAHDEGGNCAGPEVSDGGHNITFGDTSCPGTDADPKLGPLQDNGGPIRDARARSR